MGIQQAEIFRVGIVLGEFTRGIFWTPICGFGWFCLVLSGFGWFWVVLDEFGWLCLVLSTLMGLIFSSTNFREPKKNRISRVLIFANQSF